MLAVLRATYGEDLRAVAPFGSVARGSARADSDVDLLVVVRGLPDGRRRRLATLEPAERRLSADLARLEEQGLTTEVSAVLRTPDAMSITTPLLLDLTQDAVVLLDPDQIARTALDDLRVRLARPGSKLTGAALGGTGISSPTTAEGRSSVCDERHARRELLRRVYGLDDAAAAFRLRRLRTRG